MGTIIQYRPAFFEGFKNEEVKFNSLEELLNIGFVNNFKKLLNGEEDPNFYQFSIDKYSGYKGKKYLLMAEYDEGFTWWGVGFIDSIEGIEKLPVWKAKYRDKKEKDDGEGQAAN